MTLTLPSIMQLHRFVAGMLVVAAIALMAIIYALADAHAELMSTTSDNKTWTITQLENDYRDFLLALQEAVYVYSTASGDLVYGQISDIQNEFDIFYSRITVVVSTLRNFNIIDSVVDEIENVLRFRDDLASRMDSLHPEAVDVLILDGLLMDTRQIEADVRHISIDALQNIVALQEAARRYESRLLLIFLITCSFLNLILVGALVITRFLAMKHLEQQSKLAQANALAAAAVEMTSTGIIAIGADDRVLSVNSAGEAMLRIGSGSLVGGPFQTVLATERLKRMYGGALRALEKLEDPNASLGPFRLEIQRSDGETFTASVALCQSELPNRKLLRMVFLRDITNDIDAERRLSEALEAAEIHAAAQQRFLATMSHEVRTPLHGMGMVLELMLQEPLPDGLVDLVRKGQTFCKHALYQADYVLDTIRMTNVKESLTLFEPVQLVRDIRDGLVLTGQCNDDQILISVNGAVPDKGLIGQPMAFSRTISNLVGNAAKYGAGSQINVALTFRAATAGKNVDLQVEVTDHGPGIAEAELDRVFKPFQRGTQSISTPGFGLGLSIVNNAVEMMGGTISVSTAPGVGCKFILHLPLKLALDSETNRHASAGDQTKFRISTYASRELLAADPSPPALARTEGRALIVDDAKINCELAAKMLAKLGYATDLAYDGKAAVEMAAANKYDVIVMDVFMPQVTGIEAAQKIRQSGASTQAWIIAATARAYDAELLEQITADMNGHLLKPFDFNDLQSALPDCQLVKGYIGVSENKNVSDFKDILADLRNVFDLSGWDVGFELLDETLRDARLALSMVFDEEDLFIDHLHRAAGAASMGGMRSLGRALLDLERALRDETFATFEMSRLRNEAGAELARAERAIETLRACGGQGSDTAEVLSHPGPAEIIT